MDDKFAPLLVKQWQYFLNLSWGKVSDKWEKKMLQLALKMYKTTEKKQ